MRASPATERTEAWVFYDAQGVYVSARLWDSAPESQWLANEMQRDSFQLINNESFTVVLDTFYDRRNGVGFLVNPIGGFMDYEITDEGFSNIDWNPIWDVRTGRFDGGWTVEMEIPFKSLRYRPGASQIWGLQLGRGIRWKNEETYLTLVPASAGAGAFRVSAAGTLTGVEIQRGNRTFEVKPYAIGSLATDINAVPRVLNEGDGAFGVDVKYGVTQNLTADFTYNTDFAQVEVDEQQVNLTRFSLFFPEKREFFLESRGIFDFGRGVTIVRGTGGGGGRPGGGGGFLGGGDVPTLFFSRRIGLEAGQTVPILGGGRLTGKVGKFSIGAVNIQTDGVPGANALSTNFTVLRVKRDILRRSRIGGIFTGRSVSTVGDGSNEVYGLDAALSFYDNVNFNGYYARTRTPGLDGDDASYQGAFNYTGDLYGVKLDHLRVGDNFNPEVGFLRRDDFRRTFASARFSPRPASIRAVRQFTWEASFDYFENGAGQVETRLAQARFETELENSDRFGIDVPAEPRAAGAALRDCVRRYDSGRCLRLPGRLRVVLHGATAPGLGHLLHPAWRVLQRAHHGGRVSARPDRGHTTVVDRAEHLHQSDRSPGGRVHDEAGHEPRDLHPHAADVRRGPAAVQLRQRFPQHQPPAPLGVPAWQRALRGLQRPAGYGAGPQLPDAREPRIRREVHAHVPVLRRA